MSHSKKRVVILAILISGTAALCAFVAACGGRLLILESNSNSSPVIVSVTPSFTIVGSASQAIVIYGSGFIPSTMATFNGTTQTTTFINSQTLTIQLNQSDLALVGVFPITISNPLPGASTPASAAFSVWNSFIATGTVSIGYPPDWTYSDAAATSGQPEQIGFAPTGKQFDPASEYAGDIVETFLSDSSGTLDDYYNSVASDNLLVNSDSAVHIQVNGLPAIKFTNVFGMIPTNLIAIQKGQTIIEISDVGQQHQTDGLLDNFAAAVR